jgi:hypothetical protein
VACLLCSGILSDPLVMAKYLYPNLGTSVIIKTQVPLVKLFIVAFFSVFETFFCSLRYQKVLFAT